MLQTGTLYGLFNNENSVEIEKPIPNLYIYFSQNGDRKLTVKTDEKGKFRFDIPFGKYEVTASLGPGRQIRPLAAGAQFELTKDSPGDAFEKWVLAPAYLKPEENPLVVLLREIVKEASDSAVKAKESEENAKKEVSDAVGSGELLRSDTAVFLRFSYNIVSQLSEEEKDANNYKKNGIYHIATIVVGQAIKNLPFPTAGILIVAGNNADCYQKFSVYGDNRTYVRKYYKYSDRWTEWTGIYTQSNTTVDSNGFLKAASPIIKLFDDRIETNGQFKEEPVFEKIDVGTYKISNTLGLAKEGWTYEKPRGKDGNPYFRIIVKKTDDGCIISVHDEYEALEEATIVDVDGNERKINKVVKILGEARDIKPHERWIDLRFHEEPEEIEEIEEIEEEPSDLDKFLEEHNAVLL